MKAFAERCMSEYDIDGWTSNDLRVDRGPSVSIQPLN